MATQARGTMTIAVGGSTGLVGSALVEALRADGHTVKRLVRAQPAEGADEIWWKPSEMQIDDAALAGVDAFVHLGGRTVGERWTDEVKQEIRQSRVKSTRTLAEAIARMEPKPRVLVVASAMGYYGDRDDDVLDESSARGHGFLADTAVAWEAAADPARDAGVRVVHTRFANILSPDGGMLDRILPIFKLGTGGQLGDGQQWWSWVTLDDTIRAIRFVLEDDSIAGPVNVASPNPVTNEEFTSILGQVLHRPTVARVPEFALRLAFNDFADEALLASTRLTPKRLTEANFEFRDAELEGALRRILRVNE